MLGSVIGLYRRYSAASRTFFQRTQVKDWEKIAAAGPPSCMINDSHRQLHPGGKFCSRSCAGAQTLKSYIPSDCRYRPCDIVRGSPDTLLCDFNNSVYPAVNEAFQFVICSGVLEYIWKPPPSWKSCRRWAKAFCCPTTLRMPTESKIDRLSKNWVSHLDQDELQALFEATGWEWSIVNIRPLN